VGLLLCFGLFGGFSGLHAHIAYSYPGFYNGGLGGGSRGGCQVIRSGGQKSLSGVQGHSPCMGSGDLTYSARFCVSFCHWFASDTLRIQIRFQLLIKTAAVWWP